MRETAATKARRYLAEGRIIISTAEPGKVLAIARGTGQIHHAGYSAGSWWCTCETPNDRCSHIRAIQTITAPDLPAIHTERHTP